MNSKFIEKRKDKYNKASEKVRKNPEKIAMFF